MAQKCKVYLCPSTIRTWGFFCFFCLGFYETCKFIIPPKETILQYQIAAINSFLGHSYLALCLLYMVIQLKDNLSKDSGLNNSCLPGVLVPDIKMKSQTVDFTVVPFQYNQILNQTENLVQYFLCYIFGNCSYISSINYYKLSLPSWPEIIFFKPLCCEDTKYSCVLHF